MAASRAILRAAVKITSNDSTSSPVPVISPFLLIDVKRLLVMLDITSFALSKENASENKTPVEVEAFVISPFASISSRDSSVPESISACAPQEIKRRIDNMMNII